MLEISSELMAALCCSHELVIDSLSAFLVAGGAPPLPARVGPHPHARTAPPARLLLPQRPSEPPARGNRPEAGRAPARSAWGWGPKRINRS